mgnify:CR=1 FL=1
MVKFMILKVSKSSVLSGDVYISGSKNAAMPCICAALLTKQKVILKNVPDIIDVNNLLTIIKKQGVRVKKKDDIVIIQAKRLKTRVLSDLVETLRGSYYLMGSILSRKNKLKIKYPGGCNIGSRPIDYHLKAFQELGFNVIEEENKIVIREMTRTSKDVTFPKISLGATINVLLLSSTFLKEVKITNPSLEPEVLCLIDMLKKMGVSIDILDKQIIIKGARKLKGVSHSIIYDRIEAGSYIYLVGAIQKSKVFIHNAPIEHLQTVIMVARKMGIIVYKKDNILVVEGNKGIKKINLLIGEYPFFPTDLQQIITVVLTKAKSSSTIEDPIFPNRILHLKELKKMNAFIYEQNQVIHIKPCILSPGIIYATDLRCAFALIVAGAITSGTTYIKNIDYLFRGYEEPIKKLRHIGVNVEIL